MEKKYHLEIIMRKGKLFFLGSELKAHTDFIVGFKDLKHLKIKMNEIVSALKYIEPTTKNVEWATDFEIMIENIRRLHQFPSLFNDGRSPETYIWAEGHIMDNLFQV
jgi:hypothetical protein